MPQNSVIYRPRLTKKMYSLLKIHILNVRRNQEKDRAKDEENQQKRRAEEQRLQKEKENSQSLEQTKQQITEIENRSKKLISEKHEHFAKLKSLLMQDESRKHNLAKEHELMVQHPQSMLSYTNNQIPPTNIDAAHFMSGGGPSGSLPHPSNTQAQSQKYLMSQQQHHQYLSGIKRGRSTSPNAQANGFNAQQFAGFGAPMPKEFPIQASAAHSAQQLQQQQPPPPPQQQPPPPPSSQQAPPPANNSKQIKNAGPYSHRQSPSHRHHPYHPNANYHPNPPLGTGSNKITNSGHHSTAPHPPTSAPPPQSTYPGHFVTSKADSRYNNSFSGGMPPSSYLVANGESMKKEEHYKAQQRLLGQIPTGNQVPPPLSSSAKGSIVTGYSGHTNNYNCQN